MECRPIEKELTVTREKRRLEMQILNLCGCIYFKKEEKMSVVGCRSQSKLAKKQLLTHGLRAYSRRAEPIMLGVVIL